MKITAIKSQAKRAERYSIFVDDTYAFSLSDGALLETKLIVGQEISREELKHFKQLSCEDKLYANTLRFLAIRPRSEWEVEQYLKRKGSPAPLLQKILHKLRELKLLDDHDFARRWVENRQLLKPSSRRKLKLELRAKSVAPEIIAEVLGEESVDDRQVLKELVAAKRRQTKYRDDKLKLMQYLARQGFNYDDIKAAVGEEAL